MRISLVLLLLLAACRARSLDAQSILDAGLSELPDGATALSGLDDTCLNAAYSSRQMFSYIGATYAGSFVPSASKVATALSIEAIWLGGTVACAPGTLLCPPGGGHSCTTSEPTLSTRFQMHFKTADGRFDEQLNAQVSWMFLPLLLAQG